MKCVIGIAFFDKVALRFWLLESRHDDQADKLGRILEPLYHFRPFREQICRLSVVKRVVIHDDELNVCYC